MIPLLPNPFVIQMLDDLEPKDDTVLIGRAGPELEDADLWRFHLSILTVFFVYRGGRRNNLFRA